MGSSSRKRYKEWLAAVFLTNQTQVQVRPIHFSRPKVYGYANFNALFLDSGASDGNFFKRHWNLIEMTTKRKQKRRIMSALNFDDL